MKKCYTVKQIRTAWEDVLDAIEWGADEDTIDLLVRELKHAK